jgi:cyclic pyranopterin monophosphate synthase
MVDITHKISTFRQASAGAILKVSRQETIDAIKEKRVPKGDVLEMAKTAGLFAVKKTSDVIPDCHPLPIEYTAVSYEIKGLEVHIQIDVATIYKTGVEVEAMHGASVIALTMYDMLKPIDKEIEIHSIRLLNKKGGKTQFKNNLKNEVEAAVIVCSDSISKGGKEDKAGKAIMEKLKICGVEIHDYIIIPDEIQDIQQAVLKYKEKGIGLVILTGGTGLSPRDVTPEALKPLIEREIPGIAEAMRNYGQLRTPFSMLSRSVAGLIGNTLVLALPGSTKGAEESMDALFPYVLHIFRVMEALRHD